MRHRGTKKGEAMIAPPGWCPQNGAEDEIRTRDLLLGKETRYRCATSARLGQPSIVLKCYQWPASLSRRRIHAPKMLPSGLPFPQIEMLPERGNGGGR